MTIGAPAFLRVSRRDRFHRVHFDAEKGPGLSGGLGTVQGAIGACEETLQLQAHPWRRRNSHADRDGQELIPDSVRLANFAYDSTCDEFGFGVLQYVRLQHDKLWIGVQKGPR